MGYGRYEIGGVERGYMVPDVCNHPECSAPIDRGMAYLCYRCTGYFCAKHLTFAGKDLECFAGEDSQCCRACLNQVPDDDDDEDSDDH